VQAEYPQRFKLVYGSWSKGSDELAAAAGSARTLFTGVVIAAQRTGQLPAGDPERLSSLLLALTHGAVDLALAGHLSPTGRATPPPPNSPTICSATSVPPPSGRPALATTERRPPGRPGPARPAASS
jgi:hypothetical protein